MRTPWIIFGGADYLFRGRGRLVGAGSARNRDRNRNRARARARNRSGSKEPASSFVPGPLLESTTKVTLVDSEAAPNSNSNPDSERFSPASLRAPAALAPAQ